MLSYKKKHVTYANGKTMLEAEMVDDSKRILGSFLTNDVSMYYQVIVDSLKEVISGEKDLCEFNGNTCFMSARKNGATVFCDIENVYIGDDCTVTPEELLALVNAWHEDLVASGTET